MNTEKWPPVVQQQFSLKLHVTEISTGWVIANTNPEVIFRFWKVCNIISVNFVELLIKRVFRLQILLFKSTETKFKSLTLYHFVGVSVMYIKSLRSLNS